MSNRIQEMYTLLSDAVNQLSAADNDWSFRKLPGSGKYACVHSGHEEAIMKVEVRPDNSVRFKVIDTGIVRFIDKTDTFSFVMEADDLSEVQEQALLTEQLIDVLNAKHGITPPERVVWTYETLQPLSRARLNEIYTELTGRDAPNNTYPKSYVITQIINAQ